MKKIAMLILSLALLIAMGSTAFASAPPLTYSSVPTEGTPASGNVGSAEGHLDNMMSAAALTIHVITWRNSITEISSGRLKLYGLTETDWLPDKVGLDFYLQQWNGSAWVDISYSNNYMLNLDFMDLSIYRYVSHGYYYRVKTVHQGWLDGTHDSRTLYSSYIYVE